MNICWLLQTGSFKLSKETDLIYKNWSPFVKKTNQKTKQKKLKEFSKCWIPYTDEADQKMAIMYF